MGHNAHADRSRYDHITIDWMVLAVACIAILFLFGTLLRTSVDPETSGRDRLRELSGTDTLLTFQDFSFDAEGWSPDDISDRLPGLGPVLGPFGTEPVERSFAMPADVVSVQMIFDLHLIGDWADQDTFHIALGEQEILAARLVAGDERPSAELTRGDVDSIGVEVQTAFVSPRRAEADLPGARDDFLTLSVHLSVENPGSSQTLRFYAEAEGAQAEGAESEGGGAQWALDNLTVVATGPDGS